MLLPRPWAVSVFCFVSKGKKPALVLHLGLKSTFFPFRTELEKRNTEWRKICISPKLALDPMKRIPHRTLPRAFQPSLSGGSWLQRRKPACPRTPPRRSAQQDSGEQEPAT